MKSSQCIWERRRAGGQVDGIPDHDDDDEALEWDVPKGGRDGTKIAFVHKPLVLGCHVTILNAKVNRAQRNKYV